MKNVEKTTEGMGDDAEMITSSLKYFINAASLLRFVPAKKKVLSVKFKAIHHSILCVN